MKEKKALPERLRPAAMQEAQMYVNTQVRLWAKDNQIGTKPPTFPERSGAPVPSRKGSCRRRRAS